MTLELWIGFIIIAATAAFFIGRVSASKRVEIDALNRELERLKGDLETAHQQAEADLADAEAKAAAVEAGVTSHFEQSAVLFGKLAQDYRAFLEHFSESAQQLGLSEARSRELIEQGTSPLLAHEGDVVTNAAVESIEAGAPPAPEEGAPNDTEVPTLDPISAKVAELELAESKEAPRRAS